MVFPTGKLIQEETKDISSCGPEKDFEEMWKTKSIAKSSLEF